MNLLQLRTKLIELSGRFDLVTDAAGGDYTDNGADFFIYEGQKHLDRLNETQKSWASCFRFIDVGRFSASVPYCRAIKEVWAASATARWKLEKKNIQDLITDYMSGLPSSREVGEPLYYSPTITRFIPENAEVGDFESYIGWIDVPSNANEYNTILINIPTDVKIVVEVKGLFYTMQLVNETDENHWSVNHAGLLIMSAQRMMEVFNRNTQGVNDWDNAIREYNNQLGMDLVEELIAEVSQMEG
jgi:hypothetical protein